ncbi:hypothetical protein [Salinibacter ruber]|jgi:hypothetical protein|uniref:CPBP family intramembrane metalloprotease n=1 Tax=Salinibacter ruber TaxID=146919 RepID=A0A9X2ZN65_9BACT|nr:hypothetical protein [Salinibacter ruber]MCS3860047.1 hypothetical protein [Salinibacter ruber]MCS3866875.1 hypothetical protein [Salinibacter ruber]MCS4054202.1 hypothetical protein [Salinibacter ruber]
MTLTKSDRAYAVLVLSWLLIDLAFFLAPTDAIPVGQQIDAERLAFNAALAIVGGLALRAARQAGFTALWPSGSAGSTPLFLPLGTGLLLGCVPAAIDAVAPIGDIHADVPLSLPNYYVGAIFSEAMFRLIPLGLLVWIVADQVLGSQWRTPVFWACALTVGLYEPVVSWQVLSDPNGPGAFDSMTAAFAFVTLAYVLNVGAAYFFWTRGFLAAVVLRWSYYLVWHVVWPLFAY